MKIHNVLLGSVCMLAMLGGCNYNGNKVVGPSDMEDLKVGNQFNYLMTQDVSVSIKVLTGEDAPVAGVMFDLYTDKPTDGGALLGRGATDADGVFQTVLCLPTTADTVVAVGFMSTVELSIENGTAQYTFGGTSALLQTSEGDPAKTGIGSAEGDSFMDRELSEPLSSQQALAVPAPYEYVQPYNSQGVPQGLTRETITADFLARVNATLPEYRPLMTYHPDYLIDTNQLNVKIDELADVWVTFVFEGAGYMNSLGYFTYPVGTPPAKVADITKMTIIFPNASFSNGSTPFAGGGGLVSGDTLYIGRFPAGTMIGWFMVANGWNGSAVGSGYGRYFSLNNLNPEATASLKQHSILVWDSQAQKLLFSFEDTNRATSGCDHDFNDVVFYATINPVKAVDMTNVQPIDKPTDTDGDGISDVFDDYPSDPAKAFDNYVPSKNQYGTLAFEDMWPAKADYDFNDMVLSYNFDQVTNAQGNAVQIKASFMLRAIGASFANGFGIEFPFAASKVASVSGSNSPVLETTGSANAVVRVFSNAFSIIPQVTDEYINTVLEEPFHEPIEIALTVNLNTPLNKNAFTYQPPYNPFIYQNQVRSHEIHLPDYPPSSLADASLFGTVEDSSIPAQKRYYKTVDNLPWAINIPVLWDYPLERKQISWGYYALRNWAESNGASYTDWYINKPGYRNSEFIYIRP